MVAGLIWVTQPGALDRTHPFHIHSMIVKRWDLNFEQGGNFDWPRLGFIPEEKKMGPIEITMTPRGNG